MPETPNMLAEAVELLPCPFCGGAAEIVQIGNDFTKSRGFEVRCLTWGCATRKRAMVIRQPIEKARVFAANAWNRRALPAPEGEDEELAKRLVDRVGERIADEVEKALHRRQTNCEEAAHEIVRMVGALSGGRGSSGVSVAQIGGTASPKSDGLCKSEGGAS